MAEPSPPIAPNRWPRLRLGQRLSGRLLAGPVLGVRLPGGRLLRGLLLAALLLIAPALLPPSPTDDGTLATHLFRPAPAMAASELPPPSSTSASNESASRAAGGPVVVEHLRLQVPAAGLDAWLEAERGSWEPWLAQQPGFLDRQLLWDPERQEGTLLIRWASRAQWQAIPTEEVARVQNRFEALARQATGIPQGNPFPLVFEGELHPL